jgi:hypothetical protein
VSWCAAHVALGAAFYSRRGQTHAADGASPATPAVRLNGIRPENPVVRIVICSEPYNRWCVGTHHLPRKAGASGAETVSPRRFRKDARLGSAIRFGAPIAHLSDVHDADEADLRCCIARRTAGVARIPVLEVPTGRYRGRLARAPSLINRRNSLSGTP